MFDNQQTRQQLYDRIRESSRDEVILEEMKRMGFWGKKDAEPSLPEQLIKQETALSKELNALVAQQRKFQDKEKMLKEMRIKRMAEAKQKRAENKKKREQQRFEKAEAWRKRRGGEILFLGEMVSTGLNNTTNNTESLSKFGLPVFHNENDLAIAMGISLSALRFLAFSRKVSTVSHYRKFYLAKKSGGKRLISAPMPKLKGVQYWILQNILQRVNVHPSVHGFIANHSILTNAQPHIGKEVVLNIDVKDFFPSIHFKRVKGMLQQLGYAEKIATILALLCTEAVTEEVAIDGKTYFVQKGNRVLPQGAPTSPAITTILCYKLDKRLQGLADRHQCNYTRYADDVTFSTSRTELNMQQMVWRIKKILADEGFTVHPDKISIMRKGAQQQVTGIVVNQKLSVNREKRRKLRALLHNLETKPGFVPVWGQNSSAAAILGYAHFVKMVDAEKGEKFKDKVRSLIAQGKLSLTQSNNDRSGGNAGSDKPWWNVT
ncbi:RNA-directed DNA polymerase [Terrimonas sp. NA20]|uniref:RNA-directed DNA polymerase n=1 Tax=Terrimonas ginsenosidimutans TaxID=2908004 RepID=A0ABS9KT10_9BACT|nr:reverse transcriptase family protein [Terrimonas ginsenosidimutans]MCG2615433.1 RNA-directed DNA polymerase [Terrimonas ginsenosidimutans]